MPYKNMFKIPETVADWRGLKVSEVKPVLIKRRELYVLQGIVTFGQGVSYSHLNVRQYPLTIEHAGCSSSSATLTLKCLTPLPESQKSRDLDTRIRELVGVPSSQEGRVGIYRTSNGTISVGYIRINEIAEAVIRGGLVI